jgi:hypothetical protein
MSGNEPNRARRIKGCYVAFDEDENEHRAKELMKIIGSIRGVADVEESPVVPQDWYARQRVERDLKKRILDAFEEFPTKKL